MSHPAGVVVRVAGDADVGALTALRRAWGEEDLGRPIDDTPAFDAAFLAWWNAERATRTFFLVEVDAIAAGMANVKRYVRMPSAHRTTAGAWGYVGNVFVHPEHRNRGIGAELMGELAAWAGREGLAQLRLAPSTRSTPFYARLGFRPGAVVQLPLGAPTAAPA